MKMLLLIGVTTIMAAFITWLVRRYAIRSALLDVPNERSSHTVPTPRGGGVGIFAGAALGSCVAYTRGWLDLRLLAALLIGGTLVAAIGFIDDHRHVPARVRAAVHLLAALVGLWLAGGLPSLRVGDVQISLGIAGWILGAVGIVWSINLYNFMDGIDGIAATQAVMVCGVGGIFALLTGAVSVSMAAALIAASAAGFLLWNWPPAKIFMGDVGSGLLGYSIAVLAIASENAGGPPVLVWAALAAVFLVDATVTLVRRILRGEKWFEAHRRHAYQRAVQAGWSHLKVTAAVIVLNIILAGIAYGMVAESRTAPILLLGAILLAGGGYVAIEWIRPMYSDAAVHQIGHEARPDN